MRDFKALVRERVAPLALAADREQKIVDEWAAQLVEIHDALRADGLSDEDAWREVQRHLPDTETLAEDLLVAEPIALQLAARSPALRARRTYRALAGRARERLAAGLLRDVRLGLRLSSTTAASAPPSS